MSREHTMKIKWIIWVGLLCSLLGCGQERLLFHPSVLQEDYVFRFDTPYVEYNVPVDSHVFLNSVLLKNKKSKGVILYLHGNAGNISDWYSSAKVYLNNHYDVFLVDYRGFGKSKGQVTDEVTLYRDMQKVYQFVLGMYPEKKVILLGYSIGTGLASQLASVNHPRALLLLTPYYSLPDVVQSHVFFILPSWVKFKIPTYQFLSRVKSPVYIFHGKNDMVIYPESSTRLQSHINTPHEIYFLDYQGHDNIEGNLNFQKILSKVLNSLK